jgi:hypothetical protein
MERDFRGLFLACMGDKDSTVPIKNRKQKAFPPLENEKLFILLAWFSKMLVLLAAVL